MFLRACAVFAVLALVTGGFGASEASETLRVDAPWARVSTSVPRVAAGYFVVHNAGADDRLIKVEADVSRRVELHTIAFLNGASRRRVIPGLEIPANVDTVLRPGETQVMFIDLKAPLTEGDHFPLDLTFEKAGHLRVDMMVHAPGPLGGDEKAP